MWKLLPEDRASFICRVVSVHGKDPVLIAIDSGEIISVSGITTAKQQSAFSSATQLVTVGSAWKPVREMAGQLHYWDDQDVVVEHYSG